MYEEMKVMNIVQNWRNWIFRICDVETTSIIHQVENGLDISKVTYLGLGTERIQGFYMYLALFQKSESEMFQIPLWYETDDMSGITYAWIIYQYLGMCCLSVESYADACLTYEEFYDISLYGTGQIDLKDMAEYVAVHSDADIEEAICFIDEQTDFTSMTRLQDDSVQRETYSPNMDKSHQPKAEFRTKMAWAMDSYLEKYGPIEESGYEGR